MESLDRTSNPSAPPPPPEFARVARVAPAPRGPRAQHPPREVFNFSPRNLATPEQFMAARAQRGQAASKNDPQVAVKDEAPITLPQELAVPVKDEAPITLHRETAIPVKEAMSVGINKKVPISPAEALVMCVKSLGGLEMSKYVTEKYLATQKAAHEALGKSPLIVHATKEKATFQSLVPQVQTKSSVKPVINTAKEGDSVERKWSGKFSINGGPMQEGTIIISENKVSKGPRTLRLVLTIDGKPISVFSGVVPKDVAVKRDGGINLDIGPFLEKGVEGWTLMIQIPQPHNLFACKACIVDDPLRPEQSTVEQVTVEHIASEPSTSSNATASMETSVDLQFLTEEPTQIETASPSVSSEAAKLKEEQANIVNIFNSLFEQDGVAWIFAGYVEGLYGGNFLEYLFNTFNNSSLTIHDAKEAILDSVELVAGAEQMIHDFIRSSQTYTRMFEMRASGPPPGFGKKVLAEVLTIRDAIDNSRPDAALLEEASMFVFEEPQVQQEPFSTQRTYADDLSELCDFAVHDPVEAISSPYSPPTLPSLRVAAWNYFATTADPHPGSSPHSIHVHMAAPDPFSVPAKRVATPDPFSVPAEPIATTAVAHPFSSPHTPNVSLATPDTPALASKEISFTIPEPPKARGRGGNVFSPTPLRTSTEANSQGMAAMSSGDISLGDVLVSSITKNEFPEDNKAASRRVDALTAKLHGLSASKYAGNADVAQPTPPHRPVESWLKTSQPQAFQSQAQVFQPRAQAFEPQTFQPQAFQPQEFVPAPVEPAPAKPAPVKPSRLREEQLKMAKQLRSDFGLDGNKPGRVRIPKSKFLRKDGPSEKGTMPVKQLRSTRHRLLQQPPTDPLPAAYTTEQQQPRFFPPRAETHSRKESTESSTGSTTPPRRENPARRLPRINTQIDNLPVSQRDVLQAQNRANQAPRPLRLTPRQ